MLRVEPACQVKRTGRGVKEKQSAVGLEPMTCRLRIIFLPLLDPYCPKTSPRSWRRLGRSGSGALGRRSLLGWLQREQHEVIQYRREENRLLKGSCAASACVHPRATTALGGPRRASRSSAAGGGCDDRHARYDSAVAPTAHRQEMDVPEAPAWTTQRAAEDSPLWSCGWRPRIRTVETVQIVEAANRVGALARVVRK
jgi:hypothetical protein